MHTLLDAFEKSVARSPARAAASDQSLTLDYQSFRAVAGGLARQIAAATDQPRVGIMAPTSTACAVAIFAAWYAGRVPVPLNFLLGPEELRKVIADAGIELVVTIDRFAAAFAGTPLKLLVLSGQTLVPGAADAPDATDNDTGVVLYTSGTSGDPKGVCLSFNNIVRNAQACIQHARMTPDQVMLSVLPQFHSFGFTAMTVVPLLLGATVHYLPRFTPTAIVETIAGKQVTIFMAVASMYGALAGMKKAERSDYASLKLAVSGGEPLSPRVAAVFEERFGVQLNEGYGLTETSPVVSINLPWAHRAGAVGTALPGISVAAADEHGAALPAGREGELVIRGHCVMQGYHNKPEATAAAIRDGVFHTGDIGRVDAEGFIYVTGRLKDMMIIGGENVFPREIESVLCEHPAVAEAAVIGQRDELRGEVPVAFVILREGATADENELRTFCRAHLAGYKVPRDVQLRTDLPRGPTGKILKRALR